LLDLATTLVADMAIAGNMLYTVTDNLTTREFRVFEIMPSYGLTLRSSLPLPSPIEHGYAIAVEGNLVCATMRPSVPENLDSYFAVFDVTDPDAPSMPSSFDGFRWARDVALSGGYAFIADWAGDPFPAFWNEAQGLLVYDVATNPASPVLVGSYRPHGTIGGVEVYGTRAYLMDEGEGLVVLDVSNPAAPAPMGNFHSPAHLRKMDMQGNLLYVTDAWNGLTILDVNDMAAPAVAGVHQSPAPSGIGINHWGIKVSGNLAHLAAGYSGLELVDVSNPSAPSQVGNVPFSADVRAVGLDVSDNIAYVGVRSSNAVDPLGIGTFLVNFDVGNPAMIANLGFESAGGGNPVAVDVTPSGIAHIATWFPGHKIVDTSMPEDPFMISEGSEYVKDLVRRGEILYMADNFRPGTDSGLSIQDVSDLNNPVEIALIPAKDATGVALEGSRAYLAGDVLGQGRTLFAVDIGEPAVPTVLATMATVPTFNGGIVDQSVIVGGGHAFVTGQETGLAILRIRIRGDINGDALVDASDISAFTACLLSSSPAPAHLEAADINGDGMADARDAQPFGEVLLESADW